MSENGLQVTPNFLLYEALAVQAKDIVRLKRATGNQLTPKYINHVPIFSLPNEKIINRLNVLYTFRCCELKD